ncbi:MAG: hypothetical protein SGJ05_07450 [bacterium]|nr:hypothetical protein [bacterium]
MKKIIAIVIAIVVAFFLIKIAWWVLKGVFFLTLNLVGIILVLAVAVPVYFLIRKALTR